MKRFVLLLFISMTSLLMSAQTDYLTIHKKSGIIYDIFVDEIDSITFSNTKDDDIPVMPDISEYVKTGYAETISVNSAQVFAITTVPSTISLYAVGVLYSTDNNITKDNSVMLSKNITNSNLGNEYKCSFKIEQLAMNTTYYYRSFIYIVSTGKYYYGEVRSFTTSGEITADDIVDLGLPSGVCWASTNLGAASPYEYGSLYAWGETHSKESFNINNYLYYFNGEYFDIGYDISNSEFDAARQAWGESWRMPSDKDFNELITQCVWTQSTINGTQGYVITGPSGKSIFLPSSKLSSESAENGIPGLYWTSNGHALNLSYLEFVEFRKENGFSIRPVYAYIYEKSRKLPYKNASLSTFSTYNVKEYAAWSQFSNYTQATGYQTWDGAPTKSNKEVESYLISPAINTTCESGKVRISFDHTLRYTNNVTGWEDYHKIFISKDYFGISSNFNKATWTELDYTPESSSYSDWTLYSSGYINVPEEYVNCKSVYIAFYFYAPKSASTTWELENFLIEEGEAAGEAKGDGSLNNPYNTSGVVKYCESLGADNISSNEVYFEGIICSEPSIDTNYGNATFKISDDGTDNNTFYVFHTFDFGGAKFTDANKLKKGDKVIIVGNVVNYKGNTPKTIASKSYLYSINDTASEGSSEGLYISGTTVTIANTAVTPGTSSISVDLSTLCLANASEMGTVTLSDGATIAFGAGTNSNAPRYYTATNGARVYANNTITFNGKNTIATIVMECDSYNGTDYVGNTTATIYVDGNKIVYTNACDTAGAQLRVKRITITYAN